MKPVLRSSRAPGGLLGLVLLAGCAPLQWERANTDALATRNDLDQCQQQASARSQQYAFSAMPEIIVTPRGNAGIGREPHVTPPVDPARQEAFFSSCMQAKGYRLVPQR